MCEYPQAYVHDKPRARKVHKCYECRGSILPGEVYHHHHGIWDGRPDSFRLCQQCEDLMTLVNAGIAHRDYEDRTPFGGLYETVFESRDLHLIRSYLSNARARGATIKDWMAKREAELIAAATTTQPTLP